MQGRKIKKSLIFALPAVLTTTIVPLASISCGGNGGKYSYLDNIKFKIISPSITTNTEIVNEFKKNKQSIKKYIEISNPNKYDIEIRDVKSEGNDAILIDFKTSNHGKNVWDRPDRPYRISGLKDPSKEWDKGSLKKLSEILLDQIKNNPKDLIDLQNSGFKNKFPSTINSEMIKFKQNDLITKKLPEVELVANIDSYSKNDVKGALSFSLELKNKKSGSNKAKYIIANNISLSTNDGLLSLDDLASKLTVNDLNLPSDIGDLLPSNFEFDNNDILSKESILKKNKEYSKVKIQDISYDNKDAEGIKTVSFKLQHENQSTKPINLTINKFYSENKFNEVAKKLTLNDLDISIDSYLLPSNHDINKNNVKLKNNSSLLYENPNIKISDVVKIVSYDDSGKLDFDITLQDNKNPTLKWTQSLTLSGLYNTNKFSELAQRFSINGLGLNVDKYLLPTNYNVNNIKQKNNLMPFSENPNIKISEINNIVPNDNTGDITFDITLQDVKNNALKLIKKLILSGFYDTNKFKELANSFSINDLDVKANNQVFPSNYNVNNIKLKSSSPILAKNRNIKMKIKSNSVLADDGDGTLSFKISLFDSKNSGKLSFEKEFKLNGWKHLKLTSAELDSFINQIVENNKNHKVWYGCEDNWKEKSQPWEDIYVDNKTSGTINIQIMNVTHKDFKIKSPFLLDNQVSLEFVRCDDLEQLDTAYTDDGELFFGDDDNGLYGMISYKTKQVYYFKLKSSYSLTSNKTLALTITSLTTGDFYCQNYSFYGDVKVK